MWTQIGQNEESDWLRNMSQLRLAQLDALDQIDVLKRIVDDFTKRTGTARAIVGTARCRGSGARAAARSEQARRTRSTRKPAKSASPTDSELWPLPTEPAAAPELKREAPPVPR